MALRVIHCGTGNIGKEALRGILNHPDLELVGQLVHSPEKVGVDSGILAGREPCGVLATDDLQALVDLKADCYSYFGDSLGREPQTIADVVPFLENGTNVVTISIFPWAHPATCPPEYRDPIDAACRKGNTTAFFTGIDPGWATTDLAIAALACADEVDVVRVMELGWWGDYTAEHACREYFGFGKPKGHVPLLISGGFLRMQWEPTLHEIADALGVKIEEFRVLYEVDLAKSDIQTGFGIVEAGTAAAVHFELQGIVDGRPRLIVEHNDLVGRDVGGQWKLPHGPGELAYRIEIEGDPGYSVELNFDFAPGLKITAMPAINAIPAVCAATPGLKGPMEIPRYWSRNFKRDR